jgi:hypothetical protein
MNEPLKTQEPDKKDWEELYSAAREFQLNAPWEWIYSEEILGVENPLNGEVGFCSVLGSGRQEYGLGIYMGETGYNGFLRLASGKVSTQKFFENIDFTVLSMLLVDREVLQKTDLETIRGSKIQFRGKNSWPLIRSVLPGYIPWFLAKDEAVYLCNALQQIREIAGRVSRNELRLFGKENKNKIFTRCFRKGAWIDDWRQPQKPVRAPQTEEAIGAIKEAQILLMKNAAGPLDGEWELDWFVLHSPVKSESGRPFYPLCILAVDKIRGLIIGTRLIEPALTPQRKQDQLIQLLKESRPLPDTIWLHTGSLKALLKPVAESLGINLQTGPLPYLNEARKALNQRFT